MESATESSLWIWVIIINKSVLIFFVDEENDDNDNSKVNKTILTDELSDISDEDFSDPNATNLIKNKKVSVS